MLCGAEPYCTVAAMHKPSDIESCRSSTILERFYNQNVRNHWMGMRYQYMSGSGRETMQSRLFANLKLRHRCRRHPEPTNPVSIGVFVAPKEKLTEQ